VNQEPVGPEVTLHRDIASGLGELYSCSVQNKYTRIRTPFLYPDGDVIDLFWWADGEGGMISDLGETVRWLHLEHHLLQRNLADICLTHGIEENNGQLQLHIQPGDSLAMAVTRLVQAVIRVADL